MRIGVVIHHRHAGAGRSGAQARLEAHADFTDAQLGVVGSGERIFEKDRDLHAQAERLAGLFGQQRIDLVQAAGGFTRQLDGRAETPWFLRAGGRGGLTVGSSPRTGAV